MRRNADLSIVIAVAAIAHFTYFALRFGSFYFPDSFTYLDPARHLLQGHGFLGGNPVEIETLRTPGYPLLLVLFGARTVPVIVLQHLLDIGIAAAIYLFLIGRTQSRLAAMSAAILFALDVPTIHISNKLLTETLFTAILFVVFVLAFRIGQPRAAVLHLGLLIGLLVLIRPIAIVYFGVIVFRIPRRQLLAFLAAALLLPMAWATRNWIHTRVFTVSSIGNINLLTERAAGALAIEDDDDFAKDLLDEERSVTDDADDFIQTKLHIPDAEELPTAVRAKYYGPYATKIILQHKIAFAQLTVRGICVNLFESFWDAMEPVSVLHAEVLEWTLNPVPYVVFVLAMIGVLALWNRDRPLALMIALTVGYFIVMSAGAEAEARFRVPVVPQLTIAAGVGVDMIRRAAASR
jgi:hypothetical protein